MKKIIKGQLLKFRLRVISFFSPFYITRSLEKRKGLCDWKKCNAACGCGGCQFYDKEIGCHVYKYRDCRLFPCDEYERKRLAPECNYYWEDEKD